MERSNLAKIENRFLLTNFPDKIYLLNQGFSNKTFTKDNSGSFLLRRGVSYENTLVRSLTTEQQPEKNYINLLFKLKYRFIAVNSIKTEKALSSNQISFHGEK